METIKKLYIKRNITKKSFSYFKQNIQKYLTPKEQEHIVKMDDLLKYKNKYPTTIDAIKKVVMNKKRITYFMKKIRDAYYDKTTMHDYSNRIYKQFKKGDDYKSYYINNNCCKTDILNIEKMAKGFTFFSVTDYQINPSNTHILFGVDFIGNRVYHMFIKSLYTNEIKEIKIPAQPLTNIKNIYGPTNSNSNSVSNSNISDFFIWLNDEDIAYVSQNHYYNQGGIYVYNIVNHSKYLIKKIPHGKFGNINVTTDGEYILVYISTYSSDEIFIMDNDFKIKLLKKPILKLCEYVSYPVIDHDNGEWYLYEKNKGANIIKKTCDFINYDIYYKNTNPSETIDTLIYLDQHFIFTLKYLGGIKLYTITPCKKLKLVHDEKNGYIQIHNKYDNIDQFEFSIEHYVSKPIKFLLRDNGPYTYKKQHYEENIYINPHLYFTVISKSKPHLSKCIMFGYGSYNEYENAKYSPHYVALINEGYTMIIAHLRGGGDYGFKGYRDGRLLNKKNTFDDFIHIADYIVEHKITTRKKLAIWGRSAGGLMIATVINMRPDICELAIIGVPFIKVHDTLKSFKTPLGMESRDEFGNVENTEMNKYILSYDPLHNINLELLYPNIFIYSNIYDTLVPYTQPLDYYNKMKEARIFKEGINNKTIKREINIFIDNKFGHKQGSSITNKIKSYSIIFDQLERYIS